MLEVDIGGQGHPPRVNLQNFVSILPVRDTYLDLPIEPPGPPEGGIKAFGPVGRADDDQVSPALEAVHGGEDLGDYSPFYLAGHLAPLRRYCVDLVYEQDAGGVLLGVLEHLPHPGLGLAVELAHDLRAVDGVEVGLGLVGDHPG